MAPASYNILKSEPYTHKNYTVVSLRPQDIFAIMDWRNSQIDVLRQDKPLTPEGQKNYFENTIRPTYIEDQPDLILLSILEKGELIGYGGLVHINWQARRAEVSFLTETQRTEDLTTYEQDFSAFLVILKHIAFSELGFQRLSTETFNIRPHVIAILADNGFAIEGRLERNNFIEGEFVDSTLQACLNPTLPEAVSRQKNTSSKDNLLVTSVSKKIPLLSRIRKELLGVLPNARLFGSDADEHCLGKHFVDSFWHCPLDEDFTLHNLLKFCRKNKISFIIPTRDRELPFYAENSKKLREEGIHVMIPPVDAIVLCQDKLAFFEKLSRQSSLPIVATSTTLLEEYGSTITVKERFGSGSAGIGLKLTQADALKHANNLTAPVFQPFIYGTEYSVDMYLGRGSIPRSVIRSRDTVVGGESQITTVRQNEELKRLCVDLASQLGLIGHVVIQAIIDHNNSIHIIECNCRIGGASTLSMQAGLHSVTWFIEESLNKKGYKKDQTQFSNNMRLIRVPSDTFHFISSENEV